MSHHPCSLLERLPIMQSLSLFRYTVFALSLSATFFVGSCAPVSEANAGRISLIDGSNGMDNWTRLGNANWHAQDGAIQADQPNDEKGGYLVSTQSYANFRIHAEFW